MIRANEHGMLDQTENLESLEQWVRKTPRDKRNKPESLGLDFNFKDVLCPGYYTGAVWVGEMEGEQRALIVSPKFEGLNYLKMFTACAGDPVVSRHLDGVLSIWPEQQHVKANVAPQAEILIIAVFLRQLNELCLRHLRQNFIRIEQNLTGKMKGKLMMGEHLKQNIQHLRPERSYCQFQKISLDCRENRILRAALALALRVIAPTVDASSILHQWGRNCLSHLSGIPVVQIYSTDFLGMRYAGTFTHYKQPHLLARFLLKRYGADPHADKLRTYGTPPFAINMAELFERYCEVELRREIQSVWAGYDNKNLGGKLDLKVRPDFLCLDKEGNAWILDAKYRHKKYIYYEKKGIEQDNVYQVLAYSRHNAVIEKLRKLGWDSERKKLKLAVIYPQQNNDTEPLLMPKEKWELNGLELEFFRLAVSLPSI